MFQWFEHQGLSHPTRVRGLKPHGEKVLFTTLVAPHTGAWIETATCGGELLALLVAPHTGAWIETTPDNTLITSVRSHPTRVRGLKPAPSIDAALIAGRTPHGCVD